MKIDTAVNQYFSENHRFADLFNHVLFSGEHVLIPDSLKDAGNTSNLTLGSDEGKRIVQSRTRDVVKKQDDANGVTWMLFGIENQTLEHYYMPVRGMLYDSLGYMEQIKQAERQHRRRKDLKGAAEYLSGFSANDKIYPVTTLVLYYGQNDWRAPRSLHDMFAEGLNENYLKKYIPDYCINLVQINRLKDCERFETDLRAVFGLLRYKDDTKRFRKYLKSHNDWFGEMPEDAYDVLSVFLKNKSQLNELKAIVKTNKGGVDMCKAIDILQADAKLEGKMEGKLEGKREGIDAMVLLAKKLWEEGRISELIEAADDPGKKGALLRQYQIIGNVSGGDTRR